MTVAVRSGIFSRANSFAVFDRIDAASNLLASPRVLHASPWSGAAFPSSLAASALPAHGGGVYTTITATAGSQRHAVSQTPNVVAGTVYGLSFDLKKGTQRYVVLGDNGDGPFHSATFDFDTSAVTYVQNMTTVSVVQIAAEEFRVRLRFTRTNSGPATIYVGPHNASTSGNFPAWNAAGTETVHASNAVMAALP